MTTQYYEVTEGEWFPVRRKGHKNACCDCGLVHRWEFRVKGRFIEFRTWRDGRATAGVRRTMKVKVSQL